MFIASFIIYMLSEYCYLADRKYKKSNNILELVVFFDNKMLKDRRYFERVADFLCKHGQIERNSILSRPGEISNVAAAYLSIGDVIKFARRFPKNKIYVNRLKC